MPQTHLRAADRGAGRPATTWVAPTGAWHEAEALGPVDADAMARSVAGHFARTLGLDLDQGDGHALYNAVVLAVRERLVGPWRRTRRATVAPDVRRTCYLSLEFLMGRALGNAVIATDLDGPLAGALESLGTTLAEIEALEPDAGLGNGGLGRLAACFLDSCAALALPVTGYGLRYRYGMFRQAIEDGRQVERPDAWLHHGHPWEIERGDLACRVRFGGRVEVSDEAAPGPTRGTPRGGNGNGGAAMRLHRRWVDTRDVIAVPHDVPVPGAGNGIVNTLRLWEAQATDAFDLDRFNAGGYTEAVAARNEAENITMVLYPNDASENGKVLRLRQQYFLVSASLQDALRIWLEEGDGTLDGFADHHVFQLNDTHPSLAVAELMRLLVDEHDMEWDAAWHVVRRTMAYTNHTLLPEALERWSLGLIEGLLPRPVEIIREIDRRFLAEVDARWPNDAARLDAMAIVSRGHDPVVRMAHLAIVGSFSVNGVAELHSNLLRTGLFSDFAALYPERFNNKTNGVTQRRWMAHCNPGLKALLDDVVGPEWVTDMSRLERLVPLADDASFRARWDAVKAANRMPFAELLEARTGVRPTPDMMLDVQVKRIHEYKRQLLCILNVVHAWLELGGGGGRMDPGLRRERSDIAPRCTVIAGKAAPGYHMAKSIIKVANEVARVVNADPATNDRLRFVFLPDYNVSVMQIICPGTDLSEQISTAGKEASGTGNMKFMMNGALTVGTLDGANVEILEAVGDAHFFRFGLEVDEVVALRSDYRPHDVVARDPRVAAILSAFDDGTFDGDARDTVREVLAAALSSEDPWMTMADLPAYLDAQREVDAAWMDAERWTRSSIVNTAMSGRFSTDRTMRDYNRDIWHLEPLAVDESVGGAGNGTAGGADASSAPGATSR